MRWSLTHCVVLFVCVHASRVQAQESPAPSDVHEETSEPSCPRARVVDCPEATRLLNDLVEAQCLATEHPSDELEIVGDGALVHVLVGSCDMPERVELSLHGRVSRLTLEEPRETRWRFIALAIAESARHVPLAPPPAPEEASEEETSPVEASPEEPGSPWVDPRPLATKSDQERWLPFSGRLVDTGRAATAISLQLGVAVGGGVVGMGALSVRHRFEAPWTLGIEAHPALLARLDGELFGALFGAVRGGYDGRNGSVEASFGLAPSQGLRPGSVAPTAGLRLRVGVEDALALRLAFELLYASSTVKVHRAALRIQATLFRRVRLFGQVEGFFAAGIFSARIGLDYWLVGRGDAGSWSIGADLGTSFVRYVRQCEFGDCTAVGASDESFAGPSAHLRLELRL